MSRNTPAELIVCYDIRSEKRLQRVHRCMCKWGMPLQYSVFYCYLGLRARRRMENRLIELIDERVDDIRVYGIQSITNTEFLFRKPLADGIGIFGLPCGMAFQVD